MIDLRTAIGKLRLYTIAVFAAQFALIAHAQTAENTVDRGAPKTIQITTEEYAPFTSTKLKHFGVFSRIVSEAYRLEGIKADFSFFPAARSFWLAKVGDFAGTMPWADREDRKADFYYSDRVLKVGEENFFWG